MPTHKNMLESIGNALRVVYKESADEKQEYFQFKAIQGLNDLAYCVSAHFSSAFGALLASQPQHSITSLEWTPEGLTAQYQLPSRLFVDVEQGAFSRLSVSDLSLMVERIFCELLKLKFSAIQVFSETQLKEMVLSLSTDPTNSAFGPRKGSENRAYLHLRALKVFIPWRP